MCHDVVVMAVLRLCYAGESIFIVLVFLLIRPADLVTELYYQPTLSAALFFCLHLLSDALTE